MVKNLPAMQETQVKSLGQKDPLEEEMATYSSFLAWRIPWTEAPSGLQSMGLKRVSTWYFGASQVAPLVGNPSANAGDVGLIPGLGRSPGEDNGNPLQYSCLGKPMDRRTWKATVHGVTRSWTQLSD